MDFGDLNDNETIKEKLGNFHSSVEKIDNILNLALKAEIYEKLSVEEKVDYDLFIAYTLNTLYWLYLRSKGEDPNTTDIKNQLNRVKEYMIKAKETRERKTLRPKLNVPAAKRFIKHGTRHTGQNEKSVDKGPPNKKIKFS